MSIKMLDKLYYLLIIMLKEIKKKYISIFFGAGNDNKCKLIENVF